MDKLWKDIYLIRDWLLPSLINFLSDIEVNIDVDVDIDVDFYRTRVRSLSRQGSCLTSISKEVGNPDLSLPCNKSTFKSVSKTLWSLEHPTLSSSLKELIAQ